MTAANHSRYPLFMAWRANSRYRLWLAKTGETLHGCFSVCFGFLPLIVCTFRPFVSLQLASGRFRLLVPPSGTTCLSTSHLRRHSRFSDNDSRPFCFPVRPVCYYHHSSLLSGHLRSLQ